ncbi:DUF6244 family protein [Polymorphospora rubra]|uniref:DUF6244 family protein n=1 Tax=Polymorphospora rubra TaxID=338584 RepID=UPI001BB35017|nr:DUF6244 family protein [Polymorphospora rubra]
MSLVDTIQSGLRTMAAGIGRAEQETAAADHGAQQIALHAAASGFLGIAQNLARVREVIGQVQAGIGGLAVLAGEVATVLAAVPQQPTAQKTIATLASAMEKLHGIHDGVGGCIGQVGQAKQITATILQGGDPGVLLARLDAIIQILAAVGQAGTATRQQVEAAIAEARQTGSSGN